MWVEKKAEKLGVQRVNKTAEKKDEERRQVFELSSGDEKAKCKMQFWWKRRTNLTLRPDVVGGHDSCPDNPCLSPHHRKLFEKVKVM